MRTWTEVIDDVAKATGTYDTDSILEGCMKEYAKDAIDEYYTSLIMSNCLSDIERAMVGLKIVKGSLQ